MEPPQPPQYHHHPHPHHPQQQQQPPPSDYDSDFHGRQFADYDTNAGAGAGGGPVKLFVGQVPRSMEEDDLRPVLEAFGAIEDLVIIRDKLTGAHRGCAFASFYSREAAERAVAELHNKVTLPQSINPLQVRPAEGQAGGASPLFSQHPRFLLCAR